MCEHLRPRTLRAPTNPVPPPAISPPARITHNLFIQRRRPLRNRSAPAIHNATAPRPLPGGLDPDILGLELPAGTCWVDGVPDAQRVMELEAELGGVLVGVQGEELLEGSEEEERRPVRERRIDQRLVCGVRRVEGLWEHVLLGCVCLV